MPRLSVLLFAFVSVSTLCAGARGQDTLSEMPRYDRYTRLSREIYGSVKGGALDVTWADDSKSLTYSQDGKTVRYDLASKTKTDAEDAPRPRRGGRRGGGQPERGRQFDTATTEDGKRRAVSRDRNVYVSDANGKRETAVTTDGSVASRVKYGIASWVYGEELEVREAMWWSPDGNKLAFYRFDEGEVKDYYLALNQGEVQDRLDQEAYPKAGAPNPKVGLRVYDATSGKTTEVDAAFGDPTLAEYVYDVKWAPGGKELLFNRTNRKQNVMQLCAADPTTGKARVVAEERQPQSWAENHPEVTFLQDGHRFVWSTERDGYKNYVLRDLDGKELRTLTHHKADAIDLLKVDEDGGRMFYTSYGPDNPYCKQLRVVGLDGKNDRVLTDPKLDHKVTLAPDGKHFVDVAQSSDQAPETRLVDEGGKVLDVLAKSDTSKFEDLRLRKTEVFTYLAADGKTTLYGTLQFPSDFDPSKKYPVLLSVYGGPESGGINAGFGIPNPVTELGFLTVNLAGRGTMGRGKAFRDAVYGQLGIVEMDDQNAGIRSLGSRPYVDLSRVGVWGTSYGGYSTIMLMLRHPETFSAGCSSSPVTDWHNYDSIYTERFMGLPTAGDNASGYENGSSMKYAGDLKGHLMLYFGSADNNVHPSNTYQLVQALERAGRRYDMQVGTDRGHTQMNTTRMWEYFVTHLIVRPKPADPMKLVWNRRKARRAASKKA